MWVYVVCLLWGSQLENDATSTRPCHSPTACRAPSVLTSASRRSWPRLLAPRPPTAGRAPVRCARELWVSAECSAQHSPETRSRECRVPSGVSSPSRCVCPEGSCPHPLCLTSHLAMLQCCNSRRSCGYFQHTTTASGVLATAVGARRVCAASERACLAPPAVWVGLLELSQL
jgi:hypothetical protein